MRIFKSWLQPCKATYLMNWFSKIFNTTKSKKFPISNNYTNEFFLGQDSFKIGKKLSKDVVLDKSLSSERKQQKTIAALEFFDQAIEKGYNEAEVFASRGSILHDLNFHIDALNDYNICITKNAQKASYYYARAMIKSYMFDYKGSSADFQEAIRLSKFDNEDTRYWNSYAKETGYNSVTEKYELDLKYLDMAFEIYKERLKTDEDFYQKEYDEKKAKIKKRIL